MQVNVEALVQMLLSHSFIYNISCLLKKCMKYNRACKYCLLLFSDVPIQTNKLFIFRDLLKWCEKCEKKIALIYSDCEQRAKREQTHPVIFTHSENVQKGGER